MLLDAITFHICTWEYMYKIYIYPQRLSCMFIACPEDNFYLTIEKKFCYSHMLTLHITISSLKYLIMNPDKINIVKTMEK